MELEEYLKKHNLSQYKFSKISGLSPIAISRYINGKRKPNIEAIFNIHKATKGEVNFIDFLKKDKTTGA